jgi:hypothetical protein
MSNSTATGTIQCRHVNPAVRECAKACAQEHSRSKEQIWQPLAARPGTKHRINQSIAKMHE